MMLLLSLVSLLQLAPADAPFTLEVSLASPPDCANASSLTVGTLSVPASARASAELHLALCDGRKVNVHAEVERDGDTFYVLAATDNARSNSFLLVGQSFSATLSDLQFRLTVSERARP